MDLQRAAPPSYPSRGPPPSCLLNSQAAANLFGRSAVVSVELHGGEQWLGFISLARSTIKRQGLSSWTVALGLFTASVAIRVLFDPFLTGMKFLTFWPAIAGATFICGWRQGAMVVLLSAVTAWYFYIEPFNSFAVKDKATVGALVGFLVIGGLTSLHWSRRCVRQSDDWR